MTVIPMRTPDEGWIYIMRDPSRLGYCKVGKTTRDPQTRAAELSTGSPHGLVVAHQWFVNDVDAAEIEAHAHLARHRVSDDNEWFQITADKAAMLLTSQDRPRVSARRPWHRTRLAVEAFGWFSIATVIIAILAT